MGQSNDFFATLMFNKPSTFEEIASYGLTPDNTTIKDADYYKERPEVQEQFKNQEGKFDETTFNNFYTSAVAMYNDFANEDWLTNKIINGMAKDPNDWMQPFKTRIRDYSVTVGNRNDAESKSWGIAGLGSIGAPVFSVREMAQGNYVRDKDGNKLDWTPDQRSGLGGLVRSIFDPTYALAIWTEDGTHMDNGIQVPHRKGDLKVDENGMPFYEELVGESYGREILKLTDHITVDGSTLNKFDFFDADGISQSIGKTITRTIFDIAPMLIPGVGQIYGIIGAVTGLAEVMPTFAKSINNIITLGSDNAFKRQMTDWENWMGRWGRSTSDEGQQGFWNAENIFGIMSSSARQLYSQRALANMTQLMTKGGNALRASKLGQNLSLGYLALTSSKDIYSDFKQAGASDTVAGLGMLASVAALYELMSMDYFRDQIFKGTFMDESEAKHTVRAWVKEWDPKLNNIVAPGDQKVAAGMFNNFKERAKKWWLDKAEKWTMLGYAPAKGLSGMGGTLLKLGNRAMNEGVEETMEEISTDLIKATTSALEALGAPVAAEGTKELEFGFNLKDMLSRYTATFFGGALGGATFEGVDIWNRAIGAKAVQLNSLATNKQLVYLIMTGHGQELRDRARVLYEKGYLGDKNLSATETVKRDMGNGKTQEFYLKGTDTNNQGLLNLNVLLNQINYIENVIKNEGLAGALRIQYGSDGRPLIDNNNNLVLNDEFAAQKEAQENEMLAEGISSDEEYLARYKEDAVTKVIDTYRLHTSYTNDVVDLGAKILQAKQQIDTLSANTAVATTDEAKKAQSEALSKSEELKFWKDRLKDLQKQRKDLVYGKNDDIYAHQTFFVTQKSINDPFLNGAKTNQEQIDRIMGTPYWTDTVEGFGYMKYGKNWEDFTKAEQKAVQMEYDELKDSENNVDRLLRASKIHYAAWQTLASKSKDIDTKYKDKKLSEYFRHENIAGTTDEFANYKIALDKKAKNEALLKTLNTQIENENDKTKIESLVAQREDAIKEIDDADSIIGVFENRYDSYQAYALNSELTEKGWKNFYEIIRTNAQAIESLDRQAVEDSNEDETSYNIDDTISQREEELNRAISLNEDPAYIEKMEQDLKRLKERKKAYEDLYKAKMEALINFYKYMHDNKVISEDDSILKLEMSDLAAASLNKMASIEQKLKGLIADSLKEDSSLNPNAVIDQVKDYLNSLKNRQLADSMAKYEALLKLLTKELKPELDPKLFLDEQLLKQITFGQNIKAILDEINTLKKGITDFAAVDLIRGMKLNIDGVTQDVIQRLMEEQENFYTFPNAAAYNMENPAIQKVIEKIPAVINQLASLLNFSNSGFGDVINSYRAQAGKPALFSNLDPNTIKIIASDLSYLYGKAIMLLEMHRAHMQADKEFHQNSEIKLKTDFARNLFGLTAEDSIGTKLNNIIGGNINDLWKVACGDKYIDPMEVPNITMWPEYNQAWMNFIELLHNEFAKLGLTQYALGEKLADLFDENAYKMISGKITDKSGQDGNKTMTNYSTVVLLATIAGLNPGTFYSAYKAFAFEEDNPYVPIIGQEINIQIAVSSAESPDIFNALVDRLKKQVMDATANVADKERVAAMQGKTLARNFIFIQGGLGSGKTSVILNYSNKIMRILHPNDVEIIGVAPHDSQLVAFKNIIGLNDSNCIRLKDLISKIKWQGQAEGESYMDIQDYDANFHVDQIDPNISTTSKADIVFKTEANKKTLLIDEITWASERELQLLFDWAHKNNIIIIATGDLKQNGAIYVDAEHKNKGTTSVVKTGKTNGLYDCLYVTGPELTESIRMANVAQARNLRNLVVPLNHAIDWYKEHPDAADTEISTELNKYLKERIASGVKITMQYYEAPGVFVGTKFINSTDVASYIENFLKLSEDMHKDAPNEADRDPRVAYITKEENLNRWSHKKGLTVMTPAAVQGGEFDYVIIDKDFDTSNLMEFVLYKDLYTLIGRARHGAVIVNADNVINKLSIENPPIDESIKNAPVSFADDAKDLISWKAQLFDHITAMEIPEELKSTSAKQTTTSVEGKSEETPSVNVDSDKFAAVFKSDLVTDQDIDDNLPINSGTPADEGTIRDAALESEKVKKTIQGRADKVATAIKNQAVIFNPDDFIDLIMNDKFWESESAKPLADLVKDGAQAKELSRLVSQIVVDNLQMEEGHRDNLQSLTGLSSDVINAVYASWGENEPGNNRVFYSEVYGNHSIIYWEFSYKGNSYKIPVAVVNKTAEGKAYVPSTQNLFVQNANTSYAKKLVSDEHISVSTALDGKYGVGRFYSNVVRVFSPDKKTGEEDWVNSKAKSFFDYNRGKTFIIWSENELLTDDDIADIFQFKYENGKTIAFINYKNVVEDPENKDMLIYTMPNGAKFRLISAERRIGLGKLYDWVYLVRFAAGQIHADKLSNSQKQLLGGLSGDEQADRITAIHKLDTLFDGFDFDITSTADNNTERSKNSKNLYALRRSYKLLSSQRETDFLGAALYACRKVFESTSPEMRRINSNLLRVLRRGEYTTKSGNQLWPGLQISFKKDNNEKYFWVAYVAPKDIKKDKGSYAIYEYTPAGDGGSLSSNILTTIPAVGLDADEDIDRILNAINSKLGNSAFEAADNKIKQINEKLKYGDIKLQIVTRSITSNNTYFNKGNDYDLVSSIFNFKADANIDFTEIERAMMECPAFSHGIYLNDWGPDYYAGNRKVENRFASPWKKPKVKHTTEVPITSDIAGFTRSTYQLADVNWGTPQPTGSESDFDVPVDTKVFNDGSGWMKVDTPFNVKDGWNGENSSTTVTHISEDGTKVRLSNGREYDVSIDLKSLNIVKSTDADISSFTENLVNLGVDTIYVKTLIEKYQGEPDWREKILSDLNFDYDINTVLDKDFVLNTDGSIGIRKAFAGKDLFMFAKRYAKDKESKPNGNTYTNNVMKAVGPNFVVKLDHTEMVITKNGNVLSIHPASDQFIEDLEKAKDSINNVIKNNPENQRIETLLECLNNNDIETAETISTEILDIIGDDILVDIMKLKNLLSEDCI